MIKSHEENTVLFVDVEKLKFKNKVLEIIIFWLIIFILIIIFFY